ncbi:glycosyltransferase [Gelidibacter japonicus]|uniref:glycosyltransferase n=1 Tax=Gelidibacter japonicus TaxID=1962232 RepID=UPI0013D069E1|nr:glycosyltransferase [Gelidibacter japonicus]
MRILLTVDPEIPVPPTNYGGIERIVDGLITAFSNQGHEVYLVAHPDSKNKNIVKLFGWPKLHSRGILNVLSNTLYLTKVVREIKPDIIHSFSRLLYLYPSFLIAKIPVIQSYQREISEKSSVMASKIAGKKLSFTSCGEHMIKNHPIRPKCTAIHNFTNTNFFVPNNDVKKEILFFLGRIENVKGTKEAIEVALMTQEKLVIAGNISSGFEDYFELSIKPFLDNHLISYVGPINDDKKLELFQKSKAFLFPIKWEEPFGIVMAEALACGVPVIGFNRGSVPEVVKSGINGFIVEDVNGMADAVNRLNEVNLETVRKDAVKRFSVESISSEYIRLYEQKLHGLPK